MKIDLTPIFQAIITLLAALVTYKLIPWIKSKTTDQQQKNLSAAARIAVYAAEQIFNHGDNGIKYDYVKEQLARAGFALDPEELKRTIESAVHELKLTGGVVVLPEIGETVSE